MILQGAGVGILKKVITAIMGALAMVGVTPDDVSLTLGVAIGLLGGTAAAWTRERQNGQPLPKNWLIYQIAAYVMIFIIVFALAEYPGLTVRWGAATAALLSFASRDGLQAIQRRTIKQIDNFKD